MRLGTVLVALDGSPLAEAILPVVERMASPLDMMVLLVRVVPPPARGVSVMPPELAEDARVERLREAGAYLSRIAEDLGTRWIRTRTEVRVGAPAAEILAAARAASADLIAMTTHGRGGLGRLLFGSVAETLLREAPMPVVLLRMTEDAVQAAVRATRAGA